MPILQQIRADAEYLRSLIKSLKPTSTRVVKNGVNLTGDALKKALEEAKSSNRAELAKLELIIESGVIPDKYYSIINKQDYYPSSEELRKRSEMPLPQAKYFFLSNKESRKLTDLKRSQVTLYGDDKKAALSFFMEHQNDKKYPKGGFAQKVKKGYVDDTKDIPKYAVKILHKNMFSGNTMHEVRIAMRAAYCYKQLRREGFAYRRHDKQYIVTDWIHGETLDVADQKQIQKIPIPRRIVMAISLLRELSALHRLGLIHHDIKPGNVIVNHGELRFIDMDSVTPKHEKPHHGLTPMYTERFLANAQMSYDAVHNPDKVYLQFDESTDMFAMAITLFHLFQDIYIPKEIEQVIKVNGGDTESFQFKSFEIVRGPAYEEHSNLQKMLKSILSLDERASKTADDIIKQFMDVLSSYPDHDQYLKEDTLLGLGEGFSTKDGEQAFKDIEVELLCYNQRINRLPSNQLR